MFILDESAFVPGVAVTAEYFLAFLFHSLPPLMAQNLSIPLAFACLLHLANEKVGRPGKHRVSQSAYRGFH